jgi:hypothetical protein
MGPDSGEYHCLLRMHAADAVPATVGLDGHFLCSTQYLQYSHAPGEQLGEEDRGRLRGCLLAK